MFKTHCSEALPDYQPLSSAYRLTLTGAHDDDDSDDNVNDDDNDVVTQLPTTVIDLLPDI